MIYRLIRRIFGLDIDRGEWRDEWLVVPMRFRSGHTMFIQRRERPDGVIEIRRRDLTPDEEWYQSIR